jgi:hypothetical protein
LVPLDAKSFEQFRQELTAISFFDKLAASGKPVSVATR